MKNQVNNNKRPDYIQAALVLFARTIAFGVVGFIRYNEPTNDVAGILYDLTEARR